MRSALGILAGLGIGFLLAAGIERAGHLVYPPPPDLDLTDPAAVQAYASGLPAGALLFVLGGWVLATFGGGWTAGTIARSTSLLAVGVVGVVFLLGAATNLLMIPHPAWFATAAVVLIPVAAIAAGRLTRKK